MEFSTTYAFAQKWQVCIEKHLKTNKILVLKQREKQEQNISFETEGKTGTTTIQIGRKHNHEPYNSRSPETGPTLPSPKPRVPSRRAAPPTGTQRDVTWYGIPGSVWPGGVSPHPPAVPLPGVR